MQTEIEISLYYKAGAAVDMPGLTGKNFFCVKNIPFSHFWHFCASALSDTNLFESFVKTYALYTFLAIKIPYWVKLVTQSALKKYPITQFSGRTCLPKN